MNAAGSGVRRLTNSPGDDFKSVWQPAPAGEHSDTWIRSYKGTLQGTVLDGLATTEGDSLFVGATHHSHYNTDEEDLYLLKTDASGEPLWEKTLGGERFDRGNRITAGAGGSFVVLGETRSLGAGARDIYLLAIDAQGELLWSRTYGGPAEEMVLGIHATAGGAGTPC
jgi:hypothetical protein